MYCFSLQSKVWWQDRVRLGNFTKMTKDLLNVSWRIARWVYVLMGSSIFRTLSCRVSTIFISPKKHPKVFKDTPFSAT